MTTLMLRIVTTIVLTTGILTMKTITMVMMMMMIMPTEGTGDVGGEREAGIRDGDTMPMTSETAMTTMKVTIMVTTKTPSGQPLSGDYRNGAGDVTVATADGNE